MHFQNADIFNGRNDMVFKQGHAQKYFWNFEPLSLESQRWTIRQKKARRAQWRNSWLNLRKKTRKFGQKPVHVRWIWLLASVGAGLIAWVSSPDLELLNGLPSTVQVPQARASPVSQVSTAPQAQGDADAISLKPSFSLTVSHP
jgi:hypothetical protein